MVYLLGVVFLFSWSLTWCMRRYALAKQMLDIPNQRSSHQIPTPRGGGLAFVFVFSLCMACLLYLKWLTWSSGDVMLTCMGMIAALGFLDDKYSVRSIYRLIMHAVAACVVLWAISLPTFELGPWKIPQAMVFVIAFLYLVWMLNLFNFMDGIDGIAGSEAM